MSKGILLYGNFLSFWIIDIFMGDLFSSCAFCHTLCKSLKKRPSANNRQHFTTKSFTSLNILVGKTSCFLNIQGKEAFEQQFWWILWQIVQSPHEQKTSLILYNSPWTTGLSCIFRSFYHFLTCNIPEYPIYPFRGNNPTFFRKPASFVLPWLFFSIWVTKAVSFICAIARKCCPNISPRKS